MRKRKSDVEKDCLKKLKTDYDSDSSYSDCITDQITLYSISFGKKNKTCPSCSLSSYDIKFDFIDSTITSLIIKYEDITCVRLIENEKKIILKFDSEKLYNFLKNKIFPTLRMKFSPQLDEKNVLILLCKEKNQEKLETFYENLKKFVTSKNGKISTKSDSFFSSKIVSSSYGSPPKKPRSNTPPSSPFPSSLSSPSKESKSSDDSNPSSLLFSSPNSSLSSNNSITIVDNSPVTKPTTPSVSTETSFSSNKSSLISANESFESSPKNNPVSSRTTTNDNNNKSTATKTSHIISTIHSKSSLSSFSCPSSSSVSYSCITSSTSSNSSDSSSSLSSNSSKYSSSSSSNLKNLDNSALSKSKTSLNKNNKNNNNNNNNNTTNNKTHLDLFYIYEEDNINNKNNNNNNNNNRDKTNNNNNNNSDEEFFSFPSINFYSRKKKLKKNNKISSPKMSEPIVIQDDSPTPEKKNVLFNYPRYKLFRPLTFTMEDAKCLQPKQFFNDVCIDLYLKYLYYEKMDETMRCKTFIYSTFFYTHYTEKTEESQETRYEKVRKWTRDVDIFNKDFLIIPINQNFHWFLVIVCFPGLCYTIVQKQIKECVICDDKTGVKQSPIIIIFDSLSKGQPRWDISEAIRSYLMMEWNTKKNRKDGCHFFRKKIMKGCMPNCPQQNNLYDCGPFTLLYVKTFFEKPLTDFSLPLKGMKKSFTTEEADKFRPDYQDLVSKLTRECPD